MIACMWPFVLTMEAITDKEFDFGLEPPLIGLAVLAVTTPIRRDLRRLRYLLGPYALVIYSMLVTYGCLVLLIDGDLSRSALIVAALASAGGSVVMALDLRCD